MRCYYLLKVGIINVKNADKRIIYEKFFRIDNSLLVVVEFCHSKLSHQVVLCHLNIIQST